MKKKLYLGLSIFASLTVALAVSSTSNASTLAKVKKNGHVICAVNPALAGFNYVNEKGQRLGFDADFCKAVAAATLGNKAKVQWKAVSNSTRITVTSNHTVDVLSYNTTDTYSRDTDNALTFAPVWFYDGQGIMVPKKLGVKTGKDLDGASICVEIGATGEQNFAEYAKKIHIKYESIPVKSEDDAGKAIEAGRCDAFSTDKSGLAATRAALKSPSSYVILPDTLSKEPLSPATAQDDAQWSDIIRWVRNAMVIADEYGITSKNIDNILKTNKNPEILRLFGKDGNMGKMLGLRQTWAYDVIKQVGNYGELYNKYIGKGTKLNLDRGQNASWTKGGLIYAPPFR